MNSEQLNVVELSSEELVKTTGGSIDPITDEYVIKKYGHLIFGVTPEAEQQLWSAAWSQF